MEPATGNLLCLDPVGNSGLGAPCPGQPFNPDALTTASAINGFSDRIYFAGRAGSVPKADCWDAATGGRCMGLWPAPINFTPTHVFEAPTVAGTGNGACFIDRFNRLCLDPDGLPLNYSAMPSFGTGYYNNNPTRVGSRIYYSTYSYVLCWDAATGMSCPNYPLVDGNYTVVVDPSNEQCLWTNDDPGFITTWNAVAGTNTCASAYTSCAGVHAANPAAISGVYPIDADGTGPLPVANVNCDMSIF